MSILIPGQSINTNSGAQITAPQITLTSQTAPMQIPNLASLPGTVSASGTIVVVANQWYMSNGASWQAMSAQVSTASTSTQGTVELTTAPAVANTPIAVSATDTAYTNIKSGTYLTAGSGTSVSNSANTQTLSIIPATTSTIGGIKVGSGLNVTADGTLSVPPGSVATATDTTAGTVEVTVAPASGVIPVAVSNQDAAYTNVKNGTYVTAGTGITTTAGSSSQTVAISAATTSTLGGVIIGSGLNVSAGTISATPASIGALAITGGTLTGNLTLNADPTSALMAATKQYVDAVASGLQPKASVRVATTGSNITLSGLQTIDGIAVATGDRVLVKDQTNQTQNGIYIAATVAWTLASDANSSSNIKAGMFTFVDMGTTNAGTGWVLAIDPNVTITVGTTNMPFTQFSGAGDIQAGTGLTKSGNNLSVVAATTSTLGGVIVGSGINVSAGTISVTPTSVGTVTTSSNAVDTLLTTTSSATIASVTPASTRNYLVYLYFRVVTASTTLTIMLSYNDGSGAQSVTLVSGNQNVGSYHVMPIMINATNAAAVTLSATAGTANQVYVSATFLGV